MEPEKLDMKTDGGGNDDTVYESAETLRPSTKQRQVEVEDHIPDDDRPLEEEEEGDAQPSGEALHQV